MLLLLLSLAACDGESSTPPRTVKGHPADTGTLPEEDTGTATTPADDGPDGFIGSPCTTDADCPFEGGTCLPDEEGFPRGSCSMDCASTCPDADGYPVTACLDEATLPASVPGEPGSCLSRCDFGVFPYEGCRPDYGCVQVTRADPELDDVYACLPNRETSIGDCRLELANRGAAFEPQIRADEHPEEDESLTCHIEDPVKIGPVIAGVDIRYEYSEEADRVLLDCAAAHALMDTAEDLGPLGVKEILHLGTYNCRLIAGSTKLSEHGLGNAIDFAGFTLDSGETFTVLDDWEDGNDSPDTVAGLFLYDAVHRWYDDWIWNIILTPEYNDAHNDHFHVDMTDGSHVLHLLEETPHYLGPPESGSMD